MTLQAWQNDPAKKAFYIERIKAHRDADNLIQGEGWNGFKGCSIGCTFEEYDHSLHETELGLPKWLAHLQDKIHEGLSAEHAREWTLQLYDAIPVGADVNSIRKYIEIDRLDRLIKLQDKSDYPAKQDLIDALTLCKNCWLGRSDDWTAAESAAESAWAAARAAADSASWSAESARSAARSAAEAADSASWSAEAARSAAEAAAEAADSASWAAVEAADSASWAAAESEWLAERDSVLNAIKKVEVA